MATTEPAQSEPKQSIRIFGGDILKAKQEQAEQRGAQHPVHGFELWRLPRVCEVVGLSPSMIYLLMKRGDFPPSIPLTGRTRAWRSADIIAWCEARAKAGEAA